MFLYPHEANVEMAQNFQDTFHSVTFEWNENDIKDVFR